MTYEFDPDEDVETVFENIEAYMRQEARERHEVELGRLYRDGLRIRHLETYDPKIWDPNELPAEARGTLPKEFADVG